MVSLARLSPPLRAGVAALAMTFVASLAAVVIAVGLDLSAPEADGREASIPAGLLAAWAGVGVVYAAGLLSLVPPLVLARGGPQAAPLGFMAGLMTRMFLTLAGALVGTLGFGLEPRPFLLALAVVYLLLLPAELLGLPKIRSARSAPEKSFGASPLPPLSASASAQAAERGVARQRNAARSVSCVLHPPPSASSGARFLRYAEAMPGHRGRRAVRACSPATGLTGCVAGGDGAEHPAAPDQPVDEVTGLLALGGAHRTWLGQRDRETAQRSAKQRAP